MVIKEINYYVGNVELIIFITNYFVTKNAKVTNYFTNSNVVNGYC